MLDAVRTLLEDAFAGDFSEHDWSHCLGGVNAVVVEAGEVVGHAAVVPRVLRHRGRLLRCGYVEGVAVRADRRGRGLGAAAMAAAETTIRRDFELGALSATDGALGFYEARGWRRWRGPLFAGAQRTPADEGSVLVLPVRAGLDLDGPLECEPREGDAW